MVAEQGAGATPARREGRVGIPGEGPFAIVTLDVRDGRIRSLTCRTNGCPTVMAAGRAAERLLPGRTLDEADRLTAGDLVLYMGGIPEGKDETVERVVEALRCALEGGPG